MLKYMFAGKPTENKNICVCGASLTKYEIYGRHVAAGAGNATGGGGGPRRHTKKPLGVAIAKTGLFPLCRINPFSGGLNLPLVRTLHADLVALPETKLTEQGQRWARGELAEGGDHAWAPVWGKPQPQRKLKRQLSSPCDGRQGGVGARWPGCCRQCCCSASPAGRRAHPPPP